MAGPAPRPVEHQKDLLAFRPEVDRDRHESARRRIELELSRHLQAKLGRNNLRLSDEGAAPERYRKLVDEYYKRLSNRSLTP